MIETKNIRVKKKFREKLKKYRVKKKYRTKKMWDCDDSSDFSDDQNRASYSCHEKNYEN